MAGGMGDPLYRALWEEGLATYVSGVLNSPRRRKRDSASSGRPGFARQAPAASNRRRTAPEHGQHIPGSLSDLLPGKQRTEGHPTALRLLRGASNRPRASAKSQPAAVGGDESEVAAFDDPSDTSEDGTLEVDDRQYGSNPEMPVKSFCRKLQSNCPYSLFRRAQ